jgi:hypothetical protein
VIGVSAPEADLPWVREFFELFKTPWEIVVPGKRYRVVLSADDRAETVAGDVAIVYSAHELPIDRRLGIAVQSASGPITAEWNNERLPIYRRTARFTAPLDAVIRAGRTALGYRRTCGQTTVYRFGYHLFDEIGYLLTEGQPREHAASPTLELHIQLMRACLQQSRVSYVEIPARPYDHEFVCCLTHDIDFFGIRRHRGDRTLMGFAVRASAGTLFDVLRGRRPLNEAVRNWRALASLPFVFAGLARDFWQPLEDYGRVEQGRRSTFFVIPFKGRPGIAPDGDVHTRRAAPYGVGDVREAIKACAGPTTEFAVHGIDAWRDSHAGKEELHEVATVSGETKPGIRMHWLYFSPQSARRLEDAGFAYDSTWGYNDAVGYRAGTAQVFRPPGAHRLLELPLTIMDTAMFYRDRMGLNRAQAMNQCRALVEDVRRFGGALVINWHDRSLAPERQWTRCYQELLDQVGTHDAWFATGRQAIDWFQWRRSIRFAVDTSQVRIEATLPPPDLPPASLLVRRAADTAVEEIRFDGTTHTLPL